VDVSSLVWFPGEYKETKRWSGNSKTGVMGSHQPLDPPALTVPSLRPRSVTNSPGGPFSFSLRTQQPGHPGRPGVSILGADFFTIVNTICAAFPFLQTRNLHQCPLLFFLLPPTSFPHFKVLSLEGLG
jgi:hypothetical protein